MPSTEKIRQREAAREKPPTGTGTKEGEVQKGSSGGRYYEWKLKENGEGYWEKTNLSAEEAKNTRVENRENYTLTSLGPPSTNYSSAQLRYPDDGSGNAGMTEKSDYVLFQFYEYKPPFAKNSVGGAGGNASAGTQFSTNYNQGGSGAASYTTADPTYKTIVLYMPEDISTGFRGNWGGKAFSTVGANILRSAGASGFDKVKSAAETFADGAGRIKQIAGAAALRSALQAIGADSVSNDDVFSSVSGAILNPNTELLFQSSDMRNFQLNFKLVPRNGTEATTCNDIIKQFKKCTLPRRDPGTVFGFEGASEYAGFIGVPNLCRVSFMKGSNEHDVLPKFKMCAVTQVDVNYTPDGVYATYHDGQPVAMTLTLNFQETKLCFAEEVESNDVR